MTDFPYHTEETAPENAKQVFKAAEQAFGMVPNLFKKMAEAPALLESYFAIHNIFSNSSFKPIEQQVILIATSVANGCEYCVGVHSAMADMARMPEPVVEALRNGKIIPDERLQALRKFTQDIVATRGWVSDADLESFFSAGFGKQQALEVVLGVGFKTLSNYTNHIVNTELDEAFSGRRWKPEH